MKILYLSCHSILEYDEVSLLHELGMQVFSPGAYVEPRNPGDASLRPGIPGLEYDPEDVAAFHALGIPGHDNKDRLSKEFIDRFDVVIVMHMPRWIVSNWHAMKHKPVVWRTIGQSVSQQEIRLQQYRNEGLKIVRYSPKEKSIPGFCGQDTMIRFYKDPEEFKDWTGERKVIVNFTQSMSQRRAACNATLYEKVMAGLPSELYGPHNEGMNGAMGKVPYDKLKEVMRTSRVYFYTGTHPASYTLNFIEAWMTGIPIVAIGPTHGNASYGQGLYEVSDLIRNGRNGFVSDDVQELREYINQLLENEQLAQDISQCARARAISEFGKESIKERWRSFLEKL